MSVEISAPDEGELAVNQELGEIATLALSGGYHFRVWNANADDRKVSVNVYGRQGVTTFMDRRAEAQKSVVEHFDADPCAPWSVHEIPEDHPCRDQEKAVASDLVAMRAEIVELFSHEPRWKVANWGRDMVEIYRTDQWPLKTILIA